MKISFVNGLKEVYVKQSPGFQNKTFPHYVFKLSKALYGLKDLVLFC